VLSFFNFWLNQLLLELLNLFLYREDFFRLRRLSRLLMLRIDLDLITIIANTAIAIFFWFALECDSVVIDEQVSLSWTHLFWFVLWWFFNLRDNFRWPPSSCLLDSDKVPISGLIEALSTQVFDLTEQTDCHYNAVIHVKGKDDANEAQSKTLGFQMSQRLTRVWQ